MKPQLSMETVESASIGRKLSIIGDDLDQELMNIAKRSIMNSCSQQQTVTDQIYIAMMNRSHEQESISGLHLINWLRWILCR
ncbi:hypothetical protein MN116_005817 [Schistosoma mekongi]|uniref:Uncharacterized protein n=1 Tax=Schistosoma mekongi TaxID=38744 RepID=A0AAE2D3W4_SCHME|nr:hypothetical protein MN116_005817 [Schistosoma mekongi]